MWQLNVADNRSSSIQHIDIAIYLTNYGGTCGFIFGPAICFGKMKNVFV